MQLPIDQVIKLLIREYRKYLLAIVSVFVVISIVIVVIGYNWPKTYRSSTAIYADQKNIIRPLMQGLAENTQIMGKNDARELIFGRRIMREVLKAGGWMDDMPTPIDQERIIEGIKSATRIEGAGNNILRISYSHSDPETAFQVTSKYAEMFLAETVRAKKRESQEAYDFINKQVKDYHVKLLNAEEKLKEYRSSNVEIRAGKADVMSSISNLRSRLEKSKLDLKEAEIRKKSLERQLEGETMQTESLATAALYQKKIKELQEHLDLMRLSYHDTYPDIVRAKQQIADMKAAIDQENERFLAASESVGADVSTKAYLDENTGVSQLYQQLRSALSDTKTEIETHKTRITELQRLQDEELERAAILTEGEALEAELVRDYEVNKEIYQNLLRKRENARVSMHLDIEGRGVTYKIQEPANLPLVPNGLRFLHFLVLGPVIGLIAPLGLVFLLVQVDPRIRYEAILSDKLNLPVLASAPPMRVTGSYALPYFRVAGLMLVALVVYGALIWAKWVGFEFGGALGLEMPTF